MKAEGTRFGGIVYPWRADALALHLSIGADLILYRVGRDDLSLIEVSRLTLPAPVQYVWPHPTRNLLYVASSNRSISKADDLHMLSTVQLDDLGGAMRNIGEAPLPTRPIHLTVNGAGDTLLVAYNAPALLTVHAIDPNGIAMRHSNETEPGVFPHQVRMLPSGASAVVVARGNHAHADVPEQPGSLEFISTQKDGIDRITTVASKGGEGFGPRHLDFDRSGRWAAISVERQNELHVFEVLGDRFASEPAHRLTTLHAPSGAGHDQLSSTLHFHPNGRFLYVVNRNDTSVYGDGNRPSDLAGNNIAVYAFDAATGTPTLLQHVPTESVHVRTFSFDASGSLLATASILPALVRQGAGVTTVPSRLSFFRVGGDGRLTLARVHDMPNRRLSMFWSHLNGDASA
jgi:6-phosphogluconolactonase